MTVKKSKKVMSEEERNKILQKYNVCSTSVPTKKLTSSFIPLS